MITVAMEIGIHLCAWRSALSAVRPDYQATHGVQGVLNTTVKGHFNACDKSMPVGY